MELNSEDIAYAVQRVQINFWDGYIIFKKHLSLKFGLVCNINGKMKFNNDRFGDYILTGHTTTTAKDIQDISKCELRLAGWITSGFEHFSLNAQYGFINSLGKLNDKELESDNFKGNSSTIILATNIYF